VSPREAPLDLDAAVVVRLPIWANAGAIELGAVGGWTPWQTTGGNASGHLGMWFATSPHWAVQLDVGITEHGLGETAHSTGVFRVARRHGPVWRALIDRASSTR
jgi:hypothetical protein